MIDYKLIRSDRKTLSLEIDRDGVLLVRAPKRMDQETIERFIESRERWIRKKQQLMRERREIVQPDTRGVETVWYLGRQYRIERQDEPRVDFHDDVMLIPRSWSQAHLIAWLKSTCKFQMQMRVPMLAAGMDVQPTGIHVTDARTRWGSCSGKNSVNFAWRLIFCPSDVINYVIIHELCHIRHKDHSAAFWKMVAKYDPNYETHKAWLNDHAALMDLFR